jgi:hypothetical protein
MSTQNELELGKLMPSKDPDVVKRWIDDPKSLVECLRGALNQVTNCLEPGESDSGQKPKRKNGVVWNARAVFLCGVYPAQLARQIKLLKTLQPTLPFDESSLTEVSESTEPFDSTRFVRAIVKWKTDLERLTDWAELRKQLQQPLAGANRSLPDCDSAQNDGQTASRPRGQLVSVLEVSNLLKEQDCECDAKTLNNRYKKSWGDHDGKRGNAYMFNWDRIKPIVEAQFNVRFNE